MPHRKRRQWQRARLTGSSRFREDLFGRDHFFNQKGAQQSCGSSKVKNANRSNLPDLSDIERLGTDVDLNSGRSSFDAKIRVVEATLEETAIGVLFNTSPHLAGTSSTGHGAKEDARHNNDPPNIVQHLASTSSISQVAKVDARNIDRRDTESEIS